MSTASVAESDFEIETYLSQYTGHTRIQRLEFISEASPSLAREALTLALAEVKATTLNTTKHNAIVLRLNADLGASVKHDQVWVEDTARLARFRLDKLDAELKNYKSNLIKESIRMGHQDLGDHFYYCGDLASALKCYSRTRDYCSTPKHILDMCLNVIKVSIEQRNFSHVQSYVIKAESTPNPSTGSTSSSAMASAPTTSNAPSAAAADAARLLLAAKLKACMGLVHLDAGKYKSAARTFLGVGPEIIGKYTEVGSTRVLSGADIANYISLLALATFDRADIKSKLLDSSSFKQFLELADPSLRENVLGGFYAAQYGVCLDALEKLKTNFLLDMYLNSHVPHLYNLIRRRAIVAYILPFEAVNMHKMSTQFGGSVSQLETEIAQLIGEGVVKARIDSHNKLLRVNKSDDRASLFDKTLQMGEEYAKQVQFVLLRTSLMRQDLYVEPPSGGAQHDGPLERGASGRERGEGRHMERVMG
ncbi:26S proteasome subunit RPN7-domain-containing protein [Chytriomyces sp. MP71]|nr:26S proteasome subunit RPN7-domain-containing protein [Chytriomyces sp. MP71]